jgi:hypothetical protein
MLYRNIQTKCVTKIENLETGTGTGTVTLLHNYNKVRCYVQECILILILKSLKLRYLVL